MAGNRSSKGMGVGEFLDLKELVDWCVKSGFKLLQVLPVTDTCSHSPTTEQDSYPYSSKNTEQQTKNTEHITHNT